MKFTIRELCLVSLVVATGLGWWTDCVRRQLPFQLTGNAFDLAIDGEGYFSLLDHTTATMVYTRAGRLSLNENRSLVMIMDCREWPVTPEIQVPPDAASFIVQPDGLVLAQVPAADSRKINVAAIGRFQLARFAQPNRLRARGNELYDSTAEAGDAELSTPGKRGCGLVRQGMLKRQTSWF